MIARCRRCRQVLEPGFLAPMCLGGRYPCDTSWVVWEQPVPPVPPVPPVRPAPVWAALDAPTVVLPTTPAVPPSVPVRTDDDLRRDLSTWVGPRTGIGAVRDRYGIGTSRAKRLLSETRSTPKAGAR